MGPYIFHAGQLYIPPHGWIGLGFAYGGKHSGHPQMTVVTLENGILKKRVPKSFRIGTTTFHAIRSECSLGSEEYNLKVSPGPPALLSPRVTKSPGTLMSPSSPLAFSRAKHRHPGLNSIDH